ncbi:MAG: hypothetical protein AAF799_27675 [Myxococcota bacterium]
MKTRTLLSSLPFALGWLLGCGPQPVPSEVFISESGLATTSIPEDETTTDEVDASTTGEAEEPSSSGDGGVELPEDPDYPRPTPLDGGGECPPGFHGPITFDMQGWVCIPACSGDGSPTCPSGFDGDARGRCATNPFSSAESCQDNSDCTVEGERCGNMGMGQRGCLLEPTHCILRCGDDRTCPESMTCSPTSKICQYVL